MKSTTHKVKRMITQGVIFLSLFLGTELMQAQEEFTVLNYNALHGFSGDSVLQRKYVDWVKEIDPDMVAYQEMNGYTQNDIGTLGDSYGHPYAVIMNTEFGVPVTHPLAITSKFPILSVERVMDNMWHGYLYARVNEIHVFVTHLAPFTLKDRQQDIRKILAQISLIPKDEKVVLMGDFNALSPQDAGAYNEELENAMKKSEGKYIDKSNTPILRNRTIYRQNLNNGKIDYSVVQDVMDFGFKDSYYLMNQTFKNSVPTKGHAKKTSKLRRIDYIWVDEELADKLKAADVLQNENTDFLSDHYPVFVRFNL